MTTAKLEEKEAELRELRGKASEANMEVEELQDEVSLLERKVCHGTTSTGSLIIICMPIG